jgi:hypothetical protein
MRKNRDLERVTKPVNAMNGKIIVSALVGGILLFLWQSLSWAVLGLHEKSTAYAVDGQLEILESMGRHLDQNIYYLSHGNPEAGQSEYMAAVEGHPVALVNYIPVYENNMAPLMLKGLLYSVLVAFIVSLVVAGSRAAGFFGRWLVVMGFAAVLILFDSLGDQNWWFHPASWYLPEIVDYLVMFGLAGVWIAWWLGRSPARA